MSKRNRGAANRTAQRRPGNRPAGNRPQTRPPSPARPSVEAVAPEAVRTELAETRPASPSELRGPAAPTRSRAKPSGMLAARAASEYVYVAQDLRRIVAVAAVLFGIMFALWLLLEVARIRI